MIKKLLASILVVFAPIQAALGTIAILVFADLVTGIWAAKKKKDKITSKGLRRTAVKLAVYEVALALAFLAETFLIGDVVPLTKIVGAFIGLSEFKSLLENLNAISGRNLLSVLLSKLNSSEVSEK